MSRCEATTQKGTACTADSATEQPDGRMLCGRHNGSQVRKYYEAQRKRMAAGIPTERNGGRGRFKMHYDAPEEAEEAAAPAAGCAPASEMLADSDITTTEGRIEYRRRLITLLSNGKLSTKEYDSLLRAAYDQAKDKGSADGKGRKTVRFRMIESRSEADAYTAEQTALRGMQ